MAYLREFLKNKDGATALEFAILAVPLLVAILATMELSYKALQQTELDEKLTFITSEISLNAQDSTSAADFMANFFCPNINMSFIKCADVEIGVRSVMGMNRVMSLRDTSIIGEWSLGNSGDALIIELNYPVTNFMHSIVIGDIVTQSGRKHFRSRSVVRREPILSIAGS